MVPHGIKAVPDMVDGSVRCQLTGRVRVNNSHGRSGGSAGRV